MTPRRAATWFGGSTLLAAWLAAAAAPSLAPEPQSTLRTAQVSEPDLQMLALAMDAERLRNRLDVVAAPRPVTRNPFKFAEKARVTLPAPREAVAAPPAVVSLPPPVVLLGIAEDTGGPNPRRTAILSVAGDLLLVKEGEPAGSNYRVVRIGADAVELEVTAESRTLRIALP